MPSKSAILVCGMIAADPFQGGATWAVLQYVLGFRRLGHEVLFVEPVPADRVTPKEGSFESSANAQYFTRVCEEFGLTGAAALLLAGTTQTVGLPYDELRRRARQCDVLINISGLLADPALFDPIPRRVYLDLDPAFIQMWHAYDGVDMRFGGHTHFVTIGQQIGRPGCPVPTCGLDWIHTLQPIALDHWPAADPSAIERDAWTTIGNWRGYGSIWHDGVQYGQKCHSMRPFFPLPTLTSERFAPALSIHPDERDDLSAMKQNRWELLDPVAVAATPQDYQRFIRGSKGEFAVAKGGYVLSRCGWFSDRSVCYLASGRPVIAQETQFTRTLPTGEGLFAFQTIDDVLGALEIVRTDPARHARAARAIAVEHFDADRVLPRLLSAVGAGA